MGIRKTLSKEVIVTNFKKIGKLRVEISHSSMLTFSVLTLILLVAFMIRIFPLRWEIETGSLHLSEFDPYHQYRFTEFILKNGFDFWNWQYKNWIDYRSWYPQGVNVLKKSYMGLPLTAAFFYQIISWLGVQIPLMNFCALFPAIMGAFACLAIFFLGKDVGGTPVGFLSALFLALSPSYLQRTSVGFFDDESIGIVALLFFIVFFLRSVEENRSLNSKIKYALGAGATLGYFCIGWGAALYPIGVTAIFVFVLILLNRYTRHLLLSYSLTLGLGLFIAISEPKLSTPYLLTFAILPIAAIFALLYFIEIFSNLKSPKWKLVSLVVLTGIFIGGFALLWQLGYIRGLAGKFISVLNPFVREGSPLVESVAEHRISSWSSIYFDLGIAIIFFVSGFFFILKNLNNRNLFLLIFGVTSLYFACSMVRLLVLFAPAFSLLASIGVIGILKPFITLLKEPPKIFAKKKYGLGSVGKEFSGTAIFLIFIILVTSFVVSPQAGGMPRVYSQAYSPVTITAASLPIVPSDPVREWLDMLDYLKSNFGSKPIHEKVVCSWWDYGYWISMVGNVTSLADNGTWNRTQIENIGFIFMASEELSVQMLKRYNAKYILVYATIDTNGNWFGAGDEGKWAWMARISGRNQGRNPSFDRFVYEEKIIDADSMWVDEKPFGNYTLGFDGVDKNKNGRIDRDETIPNSKGQNSTIFKLMNYARERWLEVNKNQPRSQVLQFFEEEFIAGLNRSAEDSYGGIIPLVCLYKINYPES